MKLETRTYQLTATKNTHTTAYIVSTVSELLRAIIGRMRGGRGDARSRRSLVSGPIPRMRLCGVLKAARRGSRGVHHIHRVPKVRNYRRRGTVVASLESSTANKPSERLGGGLGRTMLP